MEQTFPKPKPNAGHAPHGGVIQFPEGHVSLIDAYLRGLPSDATRTVYRIAIAKLVEFIGGCPLKEITRRDVEAFRTHLEVLGRAPATINKVMVAITGLFAFALDEGIVATNPAARARRPKVPSVSPRQGLSPAEVKALIQVLDLNTLIGLRDRVLVLLLAVQAWRLSEALGLRVEDLGEESGHKVAVVHGKGAKIVRVPLAATTWTALQEWISMAAISSGPVVVPVLKGSRVQVGGRMSSQAAWKRVVLVAEQAGLTRHVHPHLFRHGAATALLDAGVPLRDVQDHLRHADPRTTRRYDSHRLSLANCSPHILASVMVPVRDAP